MRSLTAVYGARGQNASLLGEDRRPEPNPAFNWIADKLEAEEHVLSYARRYPCARSGSGRNPASEGSEAELEAHEWQCAPPGWSSC
jgi:hypothetical protein